MSKFGGWLWSLQNTGDKVVCTQNLFCLKYFKCSSGIKLTVIFFSNTKHGSIKIFRSLNRFLWVYKIISSSVPFVPLYLHFSKFYCVKQKSLFQNHFVNGRAAKRARKCASIPRFGRTNSGLD